MKYIHTPLKQIARHLNLGWSELDGSDTGGGISDTSRQSTAPTLAYHNGDLFVAWQEDVLNGIVSLKAAREIYRVALDPETLELDSHATQILRDGTEVDSGEGA